MEYTITIDDLLMDTAQNIADGNAIKIEEQLSDILTSFLTGQYKENLIRKINSKDLPQLDEYQKAIQDLIEENKK